jgi:hypothetical protein
MSKPSRRLAAVLSIVCAAAASSAEPKAVPKVQAIPQAHDQVSFQREGVEIARYHFGRDGQRPYVFPLLGPSGRSVTRIGHPRDPQSHSHHNSVWISHQNVQGLNFWEDNRALGIVHQRMIRMDDGDELAFIEAENAWLNKDGAPVMHELRRTAVRVLEKGEWLLEIDIQLEARASPVELGQTAFGLLAVRMAKTIGVNDGGGTIRNSEGGVDEAGCFRKPARWVDYSGPIKTGASEGITLMDHPSNLNHPVPFHVRDDGWMGAALTFPAAHTIRLGEPLRLRYALYIHGGVSAPEILEARWKAFAASEFLPFPVRK